MKKSDRMKKLSLIATWTVVFSFACFAQDISNVYEEEIDDEEPAAVAQPTAPQQNNASTKEAGAYSRSSVTFLDVPGYINYNLDDPRWAAYLVKSIQDTVRMARFDYNIISRRAVDKFVNMSNRMPIEERMNATIVPVILRAVDAQKEIRAQNLLSQQQKNSFITDKAKELGITEAELNAVMNSAYIFIPVYAGHEEGKNDKGEFVIKLTAGGYWWKIDNEGQEPTAKIIATIQRTRTGVDANKNKAFQDAVDLIAMDVQVATRSIPAFQLSAQIVSKSPRYVEMSIGKNEGVVIDDKYRVFESREDGAGNVTEKRRGWVMVNKIKTDTEESKSQAQIITGVPYVGATVREIPHLPFDVAIMGVAVPYSIEDGGINGGGLQFKDVKIEDYMYGPRIKISGNMANMLKETGFPVPQLWLNISGEYLFGCASGSTDIGDIKNAQSFGGELSFTKKLYIRRFVLAPEIGAGFKKVILKTGEIKYLTYDVEYGYAQYTIGGIANLGVEFAVSPLANIGAYAGLNAYSGLGGNVWTFTWTDPYDDYKWRDAPGSYDNSGDYKLKSFGLSFGVYFNMAIPSGSSREKANDLQ
ncbi:MAG: hypothetical protein FWF51_03705 [Chitinivibrionia bacterium]|nr:hypothetical protein [Chitinivibrionia bacterium]